MDKINIALISGLFALLGGFFGAFLTRRTEYEKWLRQQRSLEFAKFINQLHTIKKEALHILYDPDLLNQEKDLQITELFIGITSQENIVRLYLKDRDRKNFSDLKQNLWAVHSPDLAPHIRGKKVLEHMSDIQSIFEKTIHGNNISHHCKAFIQKTIQYVKKSRENREENSRGK